MERRLVGQLDHRVAGEAHVVKGLADGREIRASLAHRLGPLAVGLLVAEVEEDDLLAVVVDELDRIDSAPDQPVEVGAELDARNALASVPLRS